VFNTVVLDTRDRVRELGVFDVLGAGGIPSAMSISTVATPHPQVADAASLGASVDELRDAKRCTSRGGRHRVGTGSVRFWPRLDDRRFQLRSRTRIRCTALKSVR
jgi:hypothetical protein